MTDRALWFAVGTLAGAAVAGVVVWTIAHNTTTTATVGGVNPHAAPPQLGSGRYVVRDDDGNARTVTIEPA